MTIWFVRHSKPTLVPGEPAASWRLSADGRSRAEDLGEKLRDELAGQRVGIVSSAEVKAVQTAELLGLGSVTVDGRFGEVEKPWYDEASDHETAVGGFLAGLEQSGWERRGGALARFDAGIADLSSDVAIIATHGTVLSLWLSEQIADFDPTPFWLDLEMPDAWRFDARTSTVTRLV